MLLNELNAIVEKEKKMVKQGKLLDGMFGIAECKKSIRFKLNIAKGTKNLKDIYSELIIRGLTENGFNTLMIVACELMIEEEKIK